MHVLAVPNFLTAFGNIAIQNLGSLVHSFDGTWASRYLRGAAPIPINLSCHSWGVSVGLNAATNPLSRPPSVDNTQLWHSAFQPAGFNWGLNAGLPCNPTADPQHFNVIP